MNIKQLAGLLGSLILIVAVFAPIVSIPIMGSINYFQNGKGDGVIILVLAIVSLILIFLEKYKGLWVTGGISFAVMMFTFVNFHYEISGAKNDIRREFGDNPFTDLADMAIQSVQLEWGWALLIVGAALLIFSAASSSTKKYPIKTKSKLHSTSIKRTPRSVTDFILLQGTKHTAPPIRMTVDDEIVVGRSRQANIKLDNRYVSGQHLSISLNQNKEVVIKDLGSSNGTYIDGRKLMPNVATILKRGERLIIGSEDVVYTYR